MYFNCIYDFQRALYEDPELIGMWFRLVENMRAKYGVVDGNFYNFNETGFIMGSAGNGWSRADFSASPGPPTKNLSPGPPGTA